MQSKIEDLPFLIDAVDSSFINQVMRKNPLQDLLHRSVMVSCNKVRIHFFSIILKNMGMSP